MKVSAIIPTFDAAPYILRAIRSCVDITILHEIIVIDDGSTDNTLEILDEVSDPRIRILQHTDRMNHGRSASRNLGITEAAGDWIIFCDADDFCLPNRLNHLIDSDHNGIDGYYDLIEARTDQSHLKDNDKLNHTGIQEEINASDLFNHLISNRESWFNLTGLTIRKSALEDIGLFDESLEIAEDTDLIWRLARQHLLMAGGSRLAVAVRWVHASNSYHDQRDLIQGRYLFYKKWKQLIPKLNLSTEAASRINDSYKYYNRKNLRYKTLNWFRTK